jgi:GT2 family glycosyltransferase
LNYPFDLLELIVVDNISTSNIEQIIDHFNRENAGKIKTTIIRKERNYGFGKGINLATHHASADAQYILLLKPNCQLYEDTLDHLVSSALSTIDSGFRLWECRQLPSEHPKYYNPVTLETTWSTTACCLIEKTTFDEIKGFDENIFVYHEDVDLSWRFRMAGYHLMYVPSARVFHDSLSESGTFKVTTNNYSLLYNDYLRYKFGSFWDIIRFNKMFLSLFFSLPKKLENERIVLISQYLRHFLLIPSAILFRIKERRALHTFRPLFFNFNFEMHRPGAFVNQCIEESNESTLPKVSIIVRTIGRKGFLREALISIRNQTYPNIEVIVIEDGPATVQEMLQSEFRDLEIKYIPLEKNRGRSYAGSYGMEQSTGKYLRFLDEDDLLFAHSVETAVCSMLKNLEKVKLVYDLAYLVPTEVLSEDPFTYKEYGYKVQHDEEFNRIHLLDHNYIPIQCALFDRDLWEICGGFDENLEVLEDWDLWIRYSIKTDFLKIPVVTSIYRYPSDPIAGERRKKLFESYESRVKKKHSRGHSMII